MIKIKKVLVSALFVVMMLGSTSALASEIREGEKFESISSIVGKGDNGLTIETKAPAPPLSNIYTIAVASPQGGQEQMTSLPQYSTVKDHGGDWLQVLVFEMGYGQNRYGKFDGTSMKVVDSLKKDLDGDGIVDGTYYLWERNASFTGGQFTTDATSINFPWNKVSTFINVK